jgi:putative ABC transport system permease protein
MLRNLFISSWRSIQRNGTSSLINFIGLVLGFACILIIGMYIHHELSYDRYHKNADRIYRVTHNEKAGEISGIRHLATVGPPLALALKQTFSQVEDAVRFRYSPDRIMRVANTQHYETRVFYVDPSIFNVFSFPLLKGDVSSALSLPTNVVISTEMATKYFGDADPIGKTIIMDNTTALNVSGVLASLPSSTHLKFDFLIPFEAFEVPFGYPVNLNSWGWISFHTYVLLKPDVQAAAVEDQLVELVKTHWPEDVAKKFKLQLQPLKEIYLGDVTHEDVAAGNAVYITVLTIAGCLILLLGGFNFANLYTVISLTRAKEIGIRNVLGGRKQFFGRYLVTEAITIALFAALLGIGILPLAIKYLNNIGFQLVMSNATLGKLSLIACGIAILTGILAALYPISLLSSVHSQQLLKGVFRTSRTGILVRRSLVLVQFCITIALISSVLIIHAQMKYLGKKDLGYAKDELMLLRMPGDQLMQRFPTLKSQLLQNPHVVSVSLGGGRMDGDNGNVPIFVEGDLDEGIPMAIDAATFDFFRTIGTALVAGREISEQHPADTLRGVLINESAAMAFGWTPEEALGKSIRVGDIVLDGEIIGVVPDFNFGLLRSAIQPLVMYFPRTRLQNIYVRYKAATPLTTLVASIQNDWNIIAPEFPFDYTFLGEYLNSLYASEKFFFLLFQVFAAIAICISCLGLFALVSQDVLFRVKEIGIRKTLGASVMNILSLILQPFVLLIFLAGLIASPLSLLGMTNWLREFSYHVSIQWLHFVSALLVTILVALTTVGYKALRAGLRNPSESLRSD